MAASLENTVLDSGLSDCVSNTSTLAVCSSEPTTYAQASTTYLLGYYSWGAGSAFGAIAAGTPNGRQITSNAITNGTITTSGTANWWAIWKAGTLQAHGTLAASQVVTAGNTFTLTAFTIRIPNQ